MIMKNEKLGKLCFPIISLMLKLVPLTMQTLQNMAFKNVF